MERNYIKDYILVESEVVILNKSVTTYYYTLHTQIYKHTRKITTKLPKQL